MQITNGNFTKKDLWIKFKSKSIYSRTVVNTAAIIAARGKLKKTDNPILGIMLILAAFFIFSFIAASGKWLIVAGIAPMQMVFIRYFGHFIISSAILTKNGFKLSNFHTANHYLVILRAFFLFSSTALQFLAFQFLPLTVTSTIEFTAPIIICLLSWPILGERVGLFRSIAIIVGFLGVVTSTLSSEYSRTRVMRTRDWFWSGCIRASVAYLGHYVQRCCEFVHYVPRSA